ncbi:hypothetical protein D3C72_1800760 [compost metagenome]
MVNASRFQNPLPQFRMIVLAACPSTSIAITMESSVRPMANTKGSGKYRRISSVKNPATLFKASLLKSEMTTYRTCVLYTNV